MTLAANDRDESVSAMLAADRDNDPHPETCRCWPCIQDRYEPDAGSTAVALLLAALWMLGFVGLVLVGQGVVCEARGDRISYCEAGR